VMPQHRDDAAAGVKDPEVVAAHVRLRGASTRGRPRQGGARAGQAFGRRRWAGARARPAGTRGARGSSGSIITRRLQVEGGLLLRRGSDFRRTFFK
jgi:hypothetical protein